MKKHPIDDLFARKLSNWEPKASPDVWNRIEAKKQKSSSKFAWWYGYAAAGVALILMTGYLVWQGQSSTQTLAGETMARVESSRAVTPKSNEPFDEMEAGQALVANSVDISQNMDESESITLPTTHSDASFTKVDGDYVAAIELQDLQQVKKEPYVPQTIEIAKVGLPPVVPMEIPLGASEEPKTKDRVIIAHIPVEETESEGENLKSSKLFKVLRQLKNAKEGESVDWDEVGFNPKKLIARADERLKNEEEKVSKYYQNLKEKTKL